MNFNYSVTEQIEQYAITVNYNGLTGREIILINGEQKHNRLNWTSMKSEYLLILDEHNHVRIQLAVTLDSTLNISFLRGGKVLAEHNTTMYSQPESKILEEPENAAWLAELTVPKYLSIVLPGTVLLLLCLALLKNTLLAGIIMGLLALICIVLMLKPQIAASTTRPLFKNTFTKINFIRGMIFGASIGGVIGYTSSVFVNTVLSLMGIS